MIDTIAYTTEVSENSMRVDFDDYFNEDYISTRTGTYTKAYYRLIDEFVETAEKAKSEGQRFVTDKREDGSVVYMDLQDFVDEMECMVPDETDLKLVLFKSKAEANASGRSEGNYNDDDTSEFCLELETDHGFFGDVIDQLASELQDAEDNGHTYFSSSHTTWLDGYFWNIQDFKVAIDLF